MYDQHLNCEDKADFFFFLMKKYPNKSFFFIQRLAKANMERLQRKRADSLKKKNRRSE